MNKAKLDVIMSSDVSCVEKDTILASFSSFNVSTPANPRIRYGASDLPVVVEFAVAAVASGVFYDALKATIKSLYVTVRNRRIARGLEITIQGSDGELEILEEGISFHSTSGDTTSVSIDEGINLVAGSSETK